MGNIDYKLKILVLDDEEIVVARLKPALEKEGYFVETFTDSREAKKHLEEHKFDIVITDLKMASIDGMQLYRFVKQRWKHTVVVLISGFTNIDIAREALNEGVYDVISKPFKISDIKELINNIRAKIKI